MEAEGQAEERDEMRCNRSIDRSAISYFRQDIWEPQKVAWVTQKIILPFWFVTGLEKKAWKFHSSGYF